MRDAGHRTPDIGHRTAKKAKIIYPPPRGVDIILPDKSFYHDIYIKSLQGTHTDYTLRITLNDCHLLQVSHCQ